MQKATEEKLEARSSNDECGHSDRTVRLAMLVACASVLQVAESLVPHPLPGVRLGLANIVTVIALVYMGPGVAIQLAVLRTLVSSMVLGTFLTPTFVLSFCGGVVSAMVMALLFRLSLGGRPLFSLVGISVGGAASHMMTQVALVYLLFIRSVGVLWLWPWLCLAAVATGLLTGLIAVQAVRRLESREKGTAFFAAVPESDVSDVSDSSDRGSILARLRPELKIAGVMILSLAVVVFSDWRLYASVLGLLAILAVVARMSVGWLLRMSKRAWLMILAAFVMPVVFSPWGGILLKLGPLQVTNQGLHDGAVFAARILLLFLTTSLLAQTTTPHEVATALARLLWPLRICRVEPGRLARSLSLSWSYFPQFQQSVRRTVGARRGRKGWVDRAIHLPGDLIADMLRLAEAGAASAKTGA